MLEICTFPLCLNVFAAFVLCLTLTIQCDFASSESHIHSKQTLCDMLVDADVSFSFLTGAFRFRSSPVFKFALHGTRLICLADP